MYIGIIISALFIFLNIITFFYMRKPLECERGHLWYLGEKSILDYDEQGQIKSRCPTCGGKLQLKTMHSYKHAVTS